MLSYHSPYIHQFSCDSEAVTFQVSLIWFGMTHMQQLNSYIVCLVTTNYSALSRFAHKSLSITLRSISGVKYTIPIGTFIFYVLICFKMDRYKIMVNLVFQLLPIRETQPPHFPKPSWSGPPWINATVTPICAGFMQGYPNRLLHGLHDALPYRNSLVRWAVLNQWLNTWSILNGPLERCDLIGAAKFLPVDTSVGVIPNLPPL